MTPMTWTWRKGAGGWIDHPEHWHACDEDSYLACQPLIVLAASIEETNESSTQCPACVAIVKRRTTLRTPIHPSDTQHGEGFLR